MKCKELKSMSVEELKKKLNELKKDLIKDNAQIATGTTPKSPGKVRNTKKTVARVLTIINEKERQSQTPAVKEGKN